jgi:hypothetical protein
VAEILVVSGIFTNGFWKKAEELHRTLEIADSLARYIPGLRIVVGLS